MSNQNDKTLPAQRWALWIALTVYAVLQFVYLWDADIPILRIRQQAEAWGQFGDYVGGVINPIVGLITIWLLTSSLKQSQKEMVLTRKALEDAERSQKATELALQEQIKVSVYSRDLNNAATIYQAYSEDFIRLKAERKHEAARDRDVQALDGLIEETHKTVSGMTRILNEEARRLMEK